MKTKAFDEWYCRVEHVEHLHAWQASRVEALVYKAWVKGGQVQREKDKTRANSVDENTEEE